MFSLCIRCMMNLNWHCRFNYFVKMLLHVAVVTMFFNIAIIELDSFYSLPSEKTLDLPLTKVISELRERFLFIKYNSNT